MLCSAVQCSAAASCAEHVHAWCVYGCVLLKLLWRGKHKYNEDSGTYIMYDPACAL
jgi:hypothetical protein